MAIKQQTLKSSFTVQGKGLHTGAQVTMTVHPAPENSGINFKRTDIQESPIIEALAENVIETSRSTVIGKKDVRISTLEHLMAALWGCGIDNALIEIDAEEVPINDGSASKWVEEIQKAGVVEQNADREYYSISEKIEIEDVERGVKIVAYPDDEFSATVNIDYNSQVVGHQFATVENEEEFVTQIAPSRTFVFLHEIEPLISRGLIKGGDFDNAIVIVEKPLSKEEAAKIAALFNGKNATTADQQGYLNNLTLRFQNEVARHKMLDLIGDLALIGRRIKGKIIATRPGHAANTGFASLVRRQMRQNAECAPFNYSADLTPLMDINHIKALLPHRPPFLLVDKIMEIKDNHIIGIKQVTMNEQFFVGHFPEEPVMPGVLIVEAMAQCGGILALSMMQQNDTSSPNQAVNKADYSTYFAKIDDVRFKRKVVPGDTLLFHLELTAPIRRGIVQMKARCFVGNSLATEASLVAMVTKNQ